MPDDSAVARTEAPAFPERQFPDREQPPDVGAVVGRNHLLGQSVARVKETQTIDRLGKRVAGLEGEPAVESSSELRLERVIGGATERKLNGNTAEVRIGTEQRRAADLAGRSQATSHVG